MTTNDEIDVVSETLLADYRMWHDGQWDYNGDDPKQKARQAILQLKHKWERETRIDEAQKSWDNTGGDYFEDKEYLQNRITELTKLKGKK